MILVTALPLLSVVNLFSLKKTKETYRKEKSFPMVDFVKLFMMKE